MSEKEKKLSLITKQTRRNRLKVEHSNIVQKLQSLLEVEIGYNLMIPEEETFLQSKQSLTAKIVGYLGGRVEEIVFG